MLQLLYMFVASVYPQYLICFLYTYIANVSDACLKCFICLLLYVASVATRCFKSRPGCCTCCNGVSTVCFKCFIYFRSMLQRFHLYVAKVDRSVALRGWWLLLCEARGEGPCDGRGHGCWSGTRDVRQDTDTGSRAGVGAASRRRTVYGTASLPQYDQYQALLVPFIYAR
jgi:hypothetical protein